MAGFRISGVRFEGRQAHAALVASALTAVWVFGLVTTVLAANEDPVTVALVLAPTATGAAVRFGWRSSSLLRALQFLRSRRRALDVELRGIESVEHDHGGRRPTTRGDRWGIAGSTHPACG